MTIANFSKGDLVRIIAVSFPHLPHHAEWIGREGIVKKIVKCRGEVCVSVPDHGDRYCYPNNLEIVTRKEDEE